MARSPAHTTFKLADGEQVAIRNTDISVLQRIYNQPHEIKHIEQVYRRLAQLGLVTHRFAKRGDWQIALAALTDKGEQLLRAIPRAVA